MVRFLAAKVLGSLRPVDEQGESILRHVGQGEIVSLELVRPRNVRHHAKLFALLSIVLQKQEHYKSVEDLLDVCKLSIGHCRTLMTKDGMVKVPSSISFVSMDQDEFNSFYDRACGWVVTEVIPGLKRKDLDAEVEAQLLAFGAPEG